MIWLLDVDGVINAQRAGWGREPVHIRVNADYPYTLKYEPKLIKEISLLSKEIDIRWCSTWVPWYQNLNRAFGLDLRPAFTRDRMSYVWEQKVQAARETSPHGLIWTDDEIKYGSFDFDGLLISPDPRFGLRPEDIEQIKEYYARYNSEH